MNTLKNLLQLMAFLLVIPGFAQNQTYGYVERQYPTIRVDNLKSASTIQDLDPAFCRHLMIGYRELGLLDNLLNRSKFLNINTFNDSARSNPAINPDNYLQEDFDRMVVYRSVAITATQGGVKKTVTSVTEKLTKDQRELVLHADPGTEIKTSIRFHYKPEVVNNVAGADKENAAHFVVKAVPAVQASFPGGSGSLNRYFSKTVEKAIAPGTITPKTRNGVVSFTINEKGMVINPVLAESSHNPKIDKTLLEAVRKMPSWKPAADLKGTRMKQTFRFEFGYDGC